MTSSPKLYGRTGLYRLYDSVGQLLYLGIANDPEERWKMHQHEKTWWHEVAWKEVVWYDTRVRARTAERHACLTEKPRYDRFHAQNRLSPEECHAQSQAYSEQVLRRLQEDMRSGAFPDATALPAVRHLAERYGLARISISTNLPQAEKMGLVTSTHSHWLVLEPASEAAQMAKAHGSVYGLGFHLYGLHTPFRKDELISRTRLPATVVTRELGELRKAKLVDLSRVDKTTALWTLLPKQRSSHAEWRPIKDLPPHEDL